MAVSKAEDTAIAVAKENNPASPQFWVLVGSRDNFEITRDHHFAVAGIKSTRRKKAEEMRPGDYILYYLTGLMVFSGIVEITSPCYEDFKPIWSCSSDKRPEIFPYRVKTKPVLIAPNESAFIKAAPIQEELTYLRKWPDKNWTLGFQGQLHRWPENDFRRVEGYLKDAIEGERNT